MKENQNPVFVLAWVTLEGERNKKLGHGGKVVFVEHPERGWEIPGGHLNEGESPEQALIREVKEETGLNVTIREWNKQYYSEGWVAHAVTDLSPSDKSWHISDDKVDEVAWWSEVPPVIMWTEQEFLDLDNWNLSLK